MENKTAEETIKELYHTEVTFDNESDDCDLSWTDVVDLMNQFAQAKQEGIKSDTIGEIIEGVRFGLNFMSERHKLNLAGDEKQTIIQEYVIGKGFLTLEDFNNDITYPR